MIQDIFTTVSALNFRYVGELVIQQRAKCEETPTSVTDSTLRTLCAMSYLCFGHCVAVTRMNCVIDLYLVE